MSAGPGCCSGKSNRAVTGDVSTATSRPTTRLCEPFWGLCCTKNFPQHRFRVIWLAPSAHLLGLSHACNCCAPALLSAGNAAAAHLHIVVVADQGALGETVLGLAALQVPHDHGLVTVVEGEISKVTKRHRLGQTVQ
jgi:hypothetical protein